MKFAPGNDILVFSHLRWEFVTQRPQHLMHGFSRTRKILFIEEPIAPNGIRHGNFKLLKVGSNIWVLQIWTSHFLPQLYSQIIHSVCNQVGIHENPILWFYTPMFIPLLSLPHSAVVYDCMDELSNFKGAPKDLKLREKKLLKHADVVFTGGRSLYASKTKSHPRVFCFPSSVDQRHFQSAALGKLRLPRRMKSLPHPVIGFYGVIDERLDLKIMRQAALALPFASFVYIGPVVKIDPAALPRLPNIYYLGLIGYKDLPRYLQAFDIALMPFALNRATRYISPTKTLEFMAAHKPIISTAIKDVVDQYASTVKIIQTVTELKKAVGELVAETSDQKTRRTAAERGFLAQSSWSTTVKAMDQILYTISNQKAITRKSSEPVGTLYHYKVSLE